jgi:hypothetical protein
MRCLLAVAAAASLAGLRGSPALLRHTPKKAAENASGSTEKGSPLPCPEVDDLRFVVMNLARRSDRLAAMEQHLPPWICSRVCRFPSVDGRTMTRPSYVRETDWEKANGFQTHRKKEVVGETLTLGAIGLLDSSRQVWEREIAMNKTTVIMEDDVIFPDMQKLTSALCRARKRHDWDLVQFEYDRTKERGKQLSFMPDVLGHTGMYMITPAGAARALRAVETGEQHQLDAPHGPLRGSGMRGLRVNPCLAVQAGKQHLLPGKHDKDSDVQLVLPRNAQLQVSHGTCSIKDCS